MFDISLLSFCYWLLTNSTVGREHILYDFNFFTCFEVMSQDTVYLGLSLSTLEYIHFSFSWRVVWILTESWRWMLSLSSSVLTESLSSCHTSFLKGLSKSLTLTKYGHLYFSFSLFRFYFAYFSSLWLSACPHVFSGFMMDWQFYHDAISPPTW